MRTNKTQKVDVDPCFEDPLLVTYFFFQNGGQEKGTTQGISFPFRSVPPPIGCYTDHGLFACMLAIFFIVCVSVGAQQNGDVRLAAGSIYRGRVEIYLNAEWGTVRYSSEVEQRGVAQAICHQLGFWDGYGNTVSQWK